MRLVTRAAWILAVCALLWIGDRANNRLEDYIENIVRLCGIAVILAVSLNIVNGLTGQFSIGHAGFMSVGAYTGASVTYMVMQRYTYGADPNIGWMLIAMLAGGLAAALFGYIVGVPSLRLRGDYLAIVTLGFGEIIRVLLENVHDISPSLDFMGGAMGFYGVPKLSSFLIIFATAVLVIVLTRNLKFSSHGLAFMSVREDEIAADAMGVNTTRIKVAAFVLSAFFAGIGGVLFAHTLFIQPKSFNFIISINYVVMVVLGGTGSITGATLAAIALTALPEYLKTIQDRINFKDEYRLVIYALILVLMMILRPSGVFGMGELSLAGVRRWLKRRGSPVVAATEGLTAEGEEALQDEPAAGAAVGLRTDVAGGEEPLLDAVGLTRRFGGLTAVGDVNIRIRQGELVGLIGPNGAGKTTFFNLLTGVYEPSDGTLEFDGARIAGRRPYPPGARAALLLLDFVLAAVGGWIVGTILSTAVVPYAQTAKAVHLQNLVSWACIAAAVCVAALTAPRRRAYRPGYKPFQFAERGLSRTFQNIRLFGALTVLENVRIGAYLRRRTGLFDALFRTARLEREEADSILRARALLARFNLLRLQDEFARNLPYGDQRRLEIVRALATRPKLLLLDEPAAGMNPQEKADLMELIRLIRSEYGLTILLIEHDMKVVMGVCERIYVLDYGRIIATGTPDEIRRDPRVIAAYLGEDQPAAEAEGLAAATGQ